MHIFIASLIRVTGNIRLFVRRYYIFPHKKISDLIEIKFDFERIIRIP